MLKYLSHIKTTINNNSRLTIIGAISLGFLYFGKRFFNGPSFKPKIDLTNKVYIVTGANTGIGKETAKILASYGATVVIASRDEVKSQKVVQRIIKSTGNQNVEFIKLDLADLNSVREFAQNFKAKYKSLNCLINNAGVMAIPTRQLTKDGFEMQFGVNHLGHFLLTMLLVDVLKDTHNSRVINVSAGWHNKAKLNLDNLMLEKGYEPLLAYGNSKLANILFAKEFSKRYSEYDIKAVSLHPGVIRTELGRYMFSKFPGYIIKALFYPFWYFFTKDGYHGAQTTLYCALIDYSKLQSGAYYSDLQISNNVIDQAKDENLQKNLWDISEKLVGLK